MFQPLLLLMHMIADAVRRGELRRKEAALKVTRALNQAEQARRKEEACRVAAAKAERAAALALLLETASFQADILVSGQGVARPRTPCKLLMCSSFLTLLNPASRGNELVAQSAYGPDLQVANPPEFVKDPATDFVVVIAGKQFVCSLTAESPDDLTSAHVITNWIKMTL